MTKFTQVASVHLSGAARIKTISRGELRTLIEVSDKYGETIATLFVEETVDEVCAIVARREKENG